jgi:hypothetical protein
MVSDLTVLQCGQLMMESRIMARPKATEHSRELRYYGANAHKLNRPIPSREGKIAEVDGGHFAGDVKPANVKTHRRDRRFAGNQSSKRKVILVVRERDGNFRPRSFQFGESSRFIHSRSHREGNGCACR